MSATFVFKGPADSFRVMDVELKKDEPFTTDDPRLIEQLSTHVEVEAVTEDKRKSRKSDAE